MNFTQYLKEQNISLNEISKACSIPYATLHNNVEKPSTMKADNLRKVSRYLDLSMEQVMDMMDVEKSKLLTMLREQKASKLKGNIYHYTQIGFAYNTNRMEGSRLTEDETRYIFETNTLIDKSGSSSVDDVVEMANHFYLFDEMLMDIERPLTESLIKHYHELLKNGTEDGRKDWFNVGDYKQLPNEVGGLPTTEPKLVSGEMRKLLEWYLTLENVSLEDILYFHYRFEKIHPFQDGNGRVGRMIMFRECLKYNIVPFIIEDRYKAFYYRGLANYKDEPVWLMDTCLSMQDVYMEALDRFGIV